jgi:hypothetical protein
MFIFLFHVFGLSFIPYFIHLYLTVLGDHPDICAMSRIDLFSFRYSLLSVSLSKSFIMLHLSCLAILATYSTPQPIDKAEDRAQKYLAIPTLM